MNPVVVAVTHIWAVIHAFLAGIWIELHKGKVIRRSVLAIAAYLQYITMVWSMNFISNLPPEADAIGVAAMVAAVLTPASALLAASIKFYNEARQNDTSHKDD